MVFGVARIWKQKLVDDLNYGSYVQNTGEYDEVRVQVLQFLSETRVMVAMRIGGTPFTIDVEDLSVHPCLSEDYLDWSFGDD